MKGGIQKKDDMTFRANSHGSVFGPEFAIGCHLGAKLPRKLSERATNAHGKGGRLGSLSPLPTPPGVVE